MAKRNDVGAAKLFQVMTNNPISAQPVIDARVAYVRSHIP
jgi:hypothetical protein